MTTREDPVVAGHVESRRRDQGAEAAEEGVHGHVREGGASTRGRLEVNPNATVRQGLHGVVGEGRAEQVATDPLEPSAIAAVDGRGRMQVPQTWPYLIERSIPASPAPSWSSTAMSDAWRGTWRPDSVRWKRSTRF